MGTRRALERQWGGGIATVLCGERDHVYRGANLPNCNFTGPYPPDQDNISLWKQVPSSRCDVVVINFVSAQIPFWGGGWETRVSRASLEFQVNMQPFGEVPSLPGVSSALWDL